MRKTVLLALLLASSLHASETQQPNDKIPSAQVRIDYLGEAPPLDGTQLQQAGHCCVSHEFEIRSTGEHDRARATVVRRERRLGPRHWSNNTVPTP